jgi:uncharacterized repeat protein (TIGR01451 family)
VVDNTTQALIDANTVRENVADDGGGIALYGTQATLVNTVIADNRAQRSGSAIYVLDLSPRFLHTTVARNSLGEETSDGAGILIASGAVSFVNTVVVSHTTGVYAAEEASVSLEGTLWGAGAWANDVDWAGPGSIFTGAPEANVWGDPAFVSPRTGDYHIGVGSAAIDRGVSADVDSDIDHQPRPIPPGGAVDLGADESTGIDLSGSSKRASADRAGAGDTITYLITLSNAGHLSAEQVSLVDPVPGHTSYVSGSARAASGVLTAGSAITVSAQQSVTLSFAVTLTEDAAVRNTALVTDTYGTRVALTAWVNALRRYLPIAMSGTD